MLVICCWGRSASINQCQFINCLQNGTNLNHFQCYTSECFMFASNFANINNEIQLQIDSVCLHAPVSVKFYLFTIMAIVVCSLFPPPSSTCVAVRRICKQNSLSLFIIIIDILLFIWTFVCQNCCVSLGWGHIIIYLRGSTSLRIESLNYKQAYSEWSLISNCKTMARCRYWNNWYKTL